MARSYNQKLKVLYLAKILMEETDENHGITSNEIVNKLASYDVAAERKSIYNDIKALQEFGMDVINQKEKGYFLASREFELPELKLLVDAVQVSKFITAKKSKELISKLEHLTSRYEANQLQRQVVVAHRIKAMNESIYYNVDKIHIAISENKSIKFHYFEWTVKKEKRLKRDGKEYHISPWLLTWDDENYYLVGFEHGYDQIKHFRVDKMTDISICGEKRTGLEHFNRLDPAEFSKKTFGMFGGEEKDLKLEFSNNLVGVVIDRFGRGVSIRKKDDHTFTVWVKVVVSQQFFGWITALGTGVKILEPGEVTEQYKKFLGEILKDY